MKCQTCHKWMPQASMKIGDDPEGMWFFIVCPHCKEEHMGTISVENFMTKGVVSFNEDDSLIDITECLIKNNFRRVPIVAEGKLAGIISRKDVIAYILKLRHKDKAAV